VRMWCPRELDAPIEAEVLDHQSESGIAARRRTLPQGST
jgi:hypothetical protein